MSSISAGRTPGATAAGPREAEGWFEALGVKGRRAFRAALTVLPATRGREIRAVE